MIEFGLAGRTVVVTGAASGIGKSTMEAFVAEGAIVVAVDIAYDALESHIQGAGLAESVTPVRADLSTLNGVEEAAAEALAVLSGAPDVLVNNVGAGRLKTFEELTDEDFHHTFELNFHSMVRMCRAVVPGMAVRGKGAVVNITSDLSRQAEDVIVDYAASKAAVASVAKSLARAYAPAVRVNNVAPGPIWTPFYTDETTGWLKNLEAVYHAEGDDAVRAFVTHRAIPAGRMGTSEEVANAVLFLASDLAAYTTGATLGVDGGTVRATL